MPPDIHEVLYAEEVVEALVDPTASDYARALQGHRPEVIGAVALERAEGGGGGSLPAWWTVDSTPGAETLEIDAPNSTFLMSDSAISASVGPGGQVSFRAGTGGAIHFELSDDDLELDYDANDGFVLKHLTDDLLAVDPTGAVTISPSDTGADPLSVQLDGGDVFKVYSGGRTEITPVPGSADFGPLLSISADTADLGADQLMRLRVDGDSVLEVGPTGGVTISPSDASVAVTVDSAGGATAALEADALPITGVADPTNPQDAATKNYADTTFALVAAGVPDATGASAGDVLTADGGGGFAWVAP